MNKTIKEEHGCLLVSFDFGIDEPILLVGNKSKKIKGDVDIINAFKGQDAIDIYNKLTVVKKKGEINE